MNERNIIISNENNFIFSENQANFIAKYNFSLFLQPEWNNKGFITQKFIYYIQKSTKWRIYIQIHK